MRLSPWQYQCNKLLLSPEYPAITLRNVDDISDSSSKSPLSVMSHFQYPMKKCPWSWKRIRGTNLGPVKLTLKREPSYLGRSLSLLGELAHDPHRNLFFDLIAGRNGHFPKYRRCWLILRKSNPDPVAFACDDFLNSGWKCTLNSIV